MSKLRLATPEEVESIKARAALDDTSLVIAMDTLKGPILAVVRIATELDPVFYPEGLEDKRKYLFQHDVETFMFARGVPHFFFNIHASDSKWIEVAKHAGAEQLSEVPEFRFKKKV